MILKEPTIFINFKTYPQATAQNALKLAKIIDDISKEVGITIFLSPQFMDISPIISEYDIPIFVQHIDYVKPGKNTGHVTPESVKQAGCVGALINHSEKPLSDNEITTTIERCKETELISCICAAIISSIWMMFELRKISKI